MISSSIVTNDSSKIKEKASNYLSKIEGLSGTWKGDSHDSLVSQSMVFSSEMEKVSSQLGSFAEAVEAYESYQNAKNEYKSYQNKINGSDDQSLINDYKSKMNSLNSQMNDLSSKINNALSTASSYKLQATSNGKTSSTGSTTTSGVNVTGQGGQFVEDDAYGLYGHILSSIDGKVHDIYNQSQIEGWSGDCNRAAAASIASAYASYNGEAVDVAKKSSNGIGYKSDVTNNYFNNFGLSANVNRVNGKYDNVKSDIISTLSNGNYVMFDLSRPNVTGQSGQKWTSTRHWVSVLDIKKTGSGDNDYAIFVSDSGHKGSATDHGLGQGWYSIDEFSGQDIESFTTVST